MHKSHSILATGVHKQALKNAGAFQVYRKCQFHLFPLPHVSAEEAVGMYEEHWATEKLDAVIQQSTQGARKIKELWVG